MCRTAFGAKAPAVTRLSFNLADRQGLGPDLIGATVGGAGIRGLGTAMGVLCWRPQLMF